MEGDFLRDVLIVGAMILGTMITRFLPFLIFKENKETPAFITYLGKALPFATMGLLVVYCLKGVRLAAPFWGAPELLAVAAVVFLHRWKGNSLVSIGVETAFYMFLVQAVFVV